MGGAAMGPCRWGLRWASMWDRETREGYAQTRRRRHVDLDPAWILADRRAWRKHKKVSKNFGFCPSASISSCVNA
eukprot:709170-Pyramimonas_sp.AAC.1